MTQSFPILLAAALLTLPFAATAETLRLRVCYDSVELQPYINGKDQVPASNPGLAIEYLVAPAASRAGLQLELYRRPLNRCIDDMQHNRTDAFMPSVWTPERESWGRFPGPERSHAGGVDPAYSGWQASFVIIVADDSTLEWDGNSFHNLQRGLGAPIGYLANQRLQQMGVLQSANIRPETGLNMIVHQRLDGYVLERLIGQELMRRTDFKEQLRILPLPLFTTGWYVPVTHAFYAAHPDDVWRFWQALAEQRQQLEPRLQQILNAQTGN